VESAVRSVVRCDDHQQPGGPDIYLSMFLAHSVFGAHWNLLIFCHSSPFNKMKKREEILCLSWK
jgi:hypothetical protein